MQRKLNHTEIHGDILLRGTVGYGNRQMKLCWKKTTVRIKYEIEYRTLLYLKVIFGLKSEI